MSFVVSSDKQISLLNKNLLCLGVHVGHLHVYDNPRNNEILAGHRHEISVIDFNSIIHSLTTCSRFMHASGSLKADLLFYVSSLHEHSLNVRHSFIHLIRFYAKQRFFDEKWVAGQIGNFRELAIDLLYDLFFVQIPDYNVYRSKNHKRVMGFRRNLLRFRKTRYLPRVGLLGPRPQVKIKIKSVAKHTLLSYLDLVDLVLRVIFYSHFKRLRGVSFDFHFKYMLKYFKFVLLFKFYNNFLSFPDLFIYSNPTSYLPPLSEMGTQTIPAVSLVDSNTLTDNITYPVYANDDNILISFFYFQLFLKSYNSGLTTVHTNVPFYFSR